jgi:5-methylcytosine-specific restriction endonuclease McrA
MNYAEKLKDPRWQKKRLEIFNRDSFTCQCCKSTTDTLNVHHLAYERNKDPWEYEDLALVTLCEHCHALETFERRLTEDWLLNTLRRNGYSISDLINLIYAFPIKNIGDPTIVEKIRKSLRDAQ